MQEKKTVHDLEILTINGEDLYLDKDGNVVHRERRNKKKLFGDANKRVKDKATQKDMELAELLAAQYRQND